MRSNFGEFRRGSGHRQARGRPQNVRGRSLPRRTNVLQPSYRSQQNIHLPTGARVNQRPSERQNSRQSSTTGRGRNSRNNQSGIHPIGFQELESFLNEDIDANVIALKLSSEHSGLSAFMKGEINMDKVVLLFKLFEKLCNDEDVGRESMSVILNNIVSSKFIEEKIVFNLLQLLSPMNQHTDTLEIQTLLCNCLFVAKCLLQTLPNSSLHTVINLITMIDQVAVSKGLTYEIAEIRLEVDEISTSLKRKPQMPRTSLKRRQEFDGLLSMHEQDAPNDFRGIPVFPTKDDILSDEVFFRTNLVNSGYKNNDHYLDVQFRLLREDYIRPLREGIELIHRAGLKQSGISQNVKSYLDVTIDYPEMGRNGVNYWLHFNVDVLSGVRWQNTKRLMNGNLVCMSSDNFRNNFLFAVVVLREAKQLSSGLISVEFVFPPEYKTNFDADKSDAEQPIITKSSLPDLNATYTMVETDAYFEAYRHVLSGLQTLKKIPLDAHIVSCEKTMPAPYYLRQHGSIIFDFSVALEKTLVRHNYDILNTARWPNDKDLGLDDSQLIALKIALTNQLAIIQGPPGTGKTHVGLKIMKLLLSNIKKATGSENSPILVVCYTNHALDQFLEGIAEFHPTGIVRVGGRCKTESLQKYSLRELRQEKPASKMQKKMMYEHFSDRDDIMHKMENSKRFLASSKKKLLRWQDFLKTIPSHLMQQTRSVTVEEWLEIADLNRPANFQSTVLKEVLVTFHKKVAKDYDIDHVLQAVDIRGTSEPRYVVDWIVNNDFITNYSWSNYLSDIITNRLKTLTIYDHVYNKLDSDGFQTTEVQCAVFATGSKKIERLQDWFEKIIKDAEDSQDSYFDDSKNYVAEEAEFIQEMRMLDIDVAETPRKGLNSKLIQLSKDLVKRIFKDKNEGKWTKVKPNNNKLRIHLMGRDMMTSSEVSRITSLFQLPLIEKWRLYRYWVKEERKNLAEDFFRNQVAYDRISKQINEIQRENDLAVLKKADVIGMTTTGAAKYMNLVQKLQTKVVVVEEAAEVLEAHIVTAMPKSTEHLILIGDHQQLKPSPTVYELAKTYKLDISLFERMINNGIPYAKLSLQHRMRPHIADLLRVDIYNDLRDNDNVKRYESIKGVEKNIYFITHEVLEKNVNDGRSKVNDYEASYLVALCLHLLHQGYEPSEITILAAYSGQLLAFKKLMSAEKFQGVYATAIDNYQGEENEIILLSLVRSNEEGKIGFLSIENRICVALSRAKKGLYCIGNFTLLQDKSIFWKNIVDKLKENDHFGVALPLQCYNHKTFIYPAKNVNDFKKFPEGGCGKPCVVRLPCGHTCSRVCHADDQQHTKLQCSKPCLKKCPYGHKCREICLKVCPPCKKKVPKVMPMCGHIQNVECSIAVYDVKCTSIVNVDLSCGHIKQVACHLSDHKFDVTACNEPCIEILECGHVCKGTCRECLQGCLHKRCEQDCGEILFCGHTCKEKCPQKCPPCVETCNSVCEHSRCKEQCSKPCLCTEKCKWKCDHVRCDKLCSEPCDRPNCDIPCPKILLCGHYCVGFCGELCPTMCIVCSKRIGEIDLLSQKIITKETRFVQLDCGHSFEYSALDKYMFQPNIFGEPAAITTDYRRCPQPNCRKVVQTTRRYGKILKKQMQLMNDKKIEQYGNIEHLRIKKAKIQKDFNKLLVNNISFDYVVQVRKWENMLRDESSTQLDFVAKQVNAYVALKKFFKESDKMTSHVPIKSGIKSDLKKRIALLTDWVLLNRKFYTNQEEIDFKLEINRLKDAHKMLFLYSKIEASDMVAKLDRANEVLGSLTPYSHFKQKEVKQTLMDVFGALSLENPSASRKHMPWKGCWTEENVSSEVKSVVNRYKCGRGHLFYLGPDDEKICQQCLAAKY